MVLLEHLLNWGWLMIRNLRLGLGEVQKSAQMDTRSGERGGAEHWLVALAEADIGSGKGY